jgi:hypothetical protein
MLRTRSSLSAVLLFTIGALALPATAVAAGTDESYVSLVSLVYDTSGSPMESGTSQLWRASQSDIAVSGSLDDAVTVSVADGAATPAVTLSFAAPRGQSLAPGTYENAQRTADRTASHPGVQFGGDESCPRETGRFTVFDVANDLSRLHLTYEIHCDDDVHAIFGEIRVGEPSDGSGLLAAPDHVDWPVTYPGLDSRKVPVTLVNTGSDAVTLDNATISAGAADFEVTDNPCGTIAAGAACTLHVRFSPSSPGEKTGVLRLDDTTSSGHHFVQLAGRAFAVHTSWQMNSDPSDYVGDGHSWSITPANSVLMARGTEMHVQLSASATGMGSWYADFSSDAGHALLPGSTFHAREFPFNDSDPGMSVQGDGRGCDGIDGTFTVQQAAYDSDGHVTAFAVTFEQHCENAAAALFGSIAWRAPNAAAPVPTGNTSAPVAQIQAFPTTGSAVLSWTNPKSSYFDHTIVRRARGVRAPATVTDGTSDYSGRSTVLISRRLQAESAYSWSFFPVYGSGALGPARHVTLRGTRLIAHLTQTHPRKHHATTFWCRLVDANTGSGVAGQTVDVYRRVTGGHWTIATTGTSDSQGRVFLKNQYLSRRTLYKAEFDGGRTRLGSTSDPLVVTPARN